MKLVVERLFVRRGSRIVLDGLDLAANGGEAVVIEGPNGAGKTTLLRTVAGFLAAESGTIALQGADQEIGEDLSVGERTHYAGHLNGLKDSLSVADNLTFWARYFEAPDPSGSVGLALERFELDGLADIPAAYLSAGQKRRACLARLHAAKRPLWLLDEPSVSLDADASALLAGVIDEHTEGGGIVLAATHLPLGIARARTYRMEAVVDGGGVGGAAGVHDYDDWAAR